jgi:hypothetical protein
MKREFTGINGRRMTIDMSKAEMVEDMGDGETHVHTSSDWYRLREEYDHVISGWRDTA